MTDELILTEENDDLFSETLKVTDFNPPKVLERDSESFITRSPRVKIVTPIKENKRSRGRERDYRNEDSEDEDSTFQAPEPMTFSPTRSPKVDLSDDDEINRRVLKLISFSGEIKYEKEPEKIRDLCEQAFRVKFHSLSINYPQYFKDKDDIYPEGKSLNVVHKYYHEILKNIYVNMNIDNYETWYMIAWLVIELIAVKVFDITIASGITKSQMARLYKKKTLLIELGEDFFPESGGEKSSIQYRLGWSFLQDIIVFLAIKYLADCIGGEDMVEWCRELADKLLDNHITPENIESGEANNIEEGNSNLLEEMLGSFGGKGGSLKDIIVDLGTSWTESTSKNKGKKKRNRKRGGGIIYGE